MKVTKKQLNLIVNQYVDRFIDFEKQKEMAPTHVISDYIMWLYQQWESGLINIHEYRKLICIDILTFTRTI